MEDANRSSMLLVDDFTSVSDAAEIYAQLQLQPIPLFGIGPDGRCTCRSAGCKAAGKHPVGNEWQRKATDNLDVVRERFRGHHGNIGIFLAGKFVLIDADGPEGVATVDGFPEPLPQTLTAVSGSGTGGHWIYRLQSHQSADKITDRRFAPSVDVKVRGQFVAAPSVHASGNRYQWVNLQEPAGLPDWLYRLVCKPVTTAVQTARAQSASAGLKRVRAYVAKMDPAVSGAGGHNQTYAVACHVVAQGLSEDEEWEVMTEYNERCDPPWSSGELRHKLADARKNANNAPMPDRPRPVLLSVPDGATEDESWRALCIWEQTRNGGTRLARSAENAAIILLHDPAWRDCIRLDTFKQHVSLTRAPWADYLTAANSNQAWTDSDTTRLQGWLERKHNLKLPITDLDRAVQVAAERSAHSSARDWMESLEWDGVPRVHNWLTTYLGVPESEYTKNVGGWWLISAVARVYRPGCKADHMLILYGDQGVGKSSAAGILAGVEWFSDSPVPIGSKDAYLALQGKLIVEMAELDSMNRAEASAVKSFLTSTSDSFRPPFAKRNVDVPRQCVFIGTTNHVEHLRDGTGDRRFWPVTVGVVDRVGLERDRAQLWAEAVRAYKEGVRWYPETPAERALCESAQDDHKVRHPWEDRILSWSADKKGVQVAEILQHALNMPIGTWKKGDIELVHECCRRLKWRYCNDRQLTGERCRYYRIAASSAAEIDL